VILAFAERYDGHTHRGIDLAAPAGSEVRAPAAGTVVFAGTVPADGGGTCNAVTVELVDGLRVSLLPLESVLVAAGDSVSAGDGVGYLAQAGDDSSAEAHLHLGLRQGDTYLDPAGLLPGPTSATPTSAPTAGAAEPGPAPIAPTSGVQDAISTGVPEGAACMAAGPVPATTASFAAPTVNGAVSVASSADAPTSAGLQRVARDVARAHRIPVDAGISTASQLRPDVVTAASREVVLPGIVPGISTVGAVLLASVLAVGLAAATSRRAAAARVN
jgi:hypothetical protein